MTIYTRIETDKKIIALGDLHGDYENTITLLKLSGVIDESLRWIAKDTIVIQVGDILDRGSEEKKLLDFLWSLRDQAKGQGSAFYMLHGNHEIMNFSQDFRYVSPESLGDFSTGSKGEKTGLQARRQAFRLGGPLAKRLSGNNIVMVIGDTLFVHGGLTPTYADYGLENLNQEVREWLLGKTPKPTFLNDSEGPIWTRKYSRIPTPAAAEELKILLKSLNCKRMVVGHTVNPQGITSHFEELVWCIDTGISRFYNGSLQALEIHNGGEIHILAPEGCAH
ncbi:MAG: calcineurin [bacterium]|nr:calcineurin [bacterium]